MLLGHRAPLPPSCHEPERIGATLGASCTSVGSPAPRVLRVFTLAGDCVLEKTDQEMRPSSQIAEVIHMLCQKMDLKPCRLQLLDGRRRLQPHHALKSIWTSGSDLELQVVVVPGPSLDLERDLTLSNPEVLEVRHWQRTVAVRIRPARLLESLAEEVKLHHRVTLSSPRIFGKVHSSSADMEEMALNTAPVDDSGPGCDLVLELDEGFYGGLDTGFRSLKMYYGVLTLDYWATGEFHTYLGGGVRQNEVCHCMDVAGFLQESLAFVFLWTSDLLRTVCAMWLVGSMLHEGLVEQFFLLLTLWLPGFVWALRFHLYFSKQQWSSFCWPTLRCALLWLSGLWWIWTPNALILASLVSPIYFSYKLLLLLTHFLRPFAEPPSFPVNPDLFSLYELYMRDTCIFGDALRVFLLLFWLLGHVTGQKVVPYLSLLSSLGSLLLASLPYRRRMRAEAWSYFQDFLMANEEEEELVNAA